MTAQIRRADFANYESYMDAIAEPVGGAITLLAWDEDEQVFLLNPAWVAAQERRGRRVPPGEPPTA